MNYYGNPTTVEEKAEAYEKDFTQKNFIFKIICLAVGILIALIAFGMWGVPTYNVWHAEMNGKAQLSEAEYAKQVQVQEANANLEAEKLNAEAEVARAEGAAEARNVEGLGMTPEQYVQYLWVKKLSLAEADVIYMPTDGGLPVMTQNVR